MRYKRRNWPTNKLPPPKHPTLQSPRGQGSKSHPKRVHWRAASPLGFRPVLKGFMPPRSRPPFYVNPSLINPITAASPLLSLGALTYVLPVAALTAPIAVFLILAHVKYSKPLNIDLKSCIFENMGGFPPVLGATRGFSSIARPLSSQGQLGQVKRPLSRIFGQHLFLFPASGGKAFTDRHRVSGVWSPPYCRI